MPSVCRRSTWTTAAACLPCLRLGGRGLLRSLGTRWGGGPTAASQQLLHHTHQSGDELRREVEADAGAARQGCDLGAGRSGSAVRAGLLLEAGDLSPPQIGQRFGGRDHSTVLHGCNKVKSLMAEQRSTLQQIQELTARIRTRAKSL